MQPMLERALEAQHGTQLKQVGVHGKAKRIKQRVGKFPLKRMRHVTCLKTEDMPDWLMYSRTGIALPRRIQSSRPAHIPDM